LAIRTFRKLSEDFQKFPKTFNRPLRDICTHWGPIRPHSGATIYHNLDPPETDKREREWPVKKTIRIQIETDTVWIIHWRGGARGIRCQTCGPEADVNAEEPAVTAAVAPVAVQRRLKAPRFWLVEAPGQAVRGWLESLRLLVQKNGG
jgi:hypothetical protein